MDDEEDKTLLNFYRLNPGELWGNVYSKYNQTTNQLDHDRGDALWIVADYKVPHNGNEDRIIAHWFERETYTLYLFKNIGEELWLMHGYEDGEYKRYDKGFGIFYKRSLIDHLFGVAKAIKMGKVI